MLLTLFRQRFLLAFLQKLQLFFGPQRELCKADAQETRQGAQTAVTPVASRVPSITTADSVKVSQINRSLVQTMGSASAFQNSIVP